MMRKLGERHWTDTWFMWRGRCWVSFENGWSWREDGWWFFGYNVWVPKRKHFLVGLKYRLFSGGNNYWYMEERRNLIATDEELFE